MSWRGGRGRGRAKWAWRDLANVAEGRRWAVLRARSCELDGLLARPGEVGV